MNAIAAEHDRLNAEWKLIFEQMEKPDGVNEESLARSSTSNRQAKRFGVP
jgi:hypothetical protein